MPSTFFPADGFFNEDFGLFFSFGHEFFSEKLDWPDEDENIVSRRIDGSFISALAVFNHFQRFLDGQDIYETDKKNEMDWNFLQLLN